MMITTTYLEPQFDTRKSFYNKAKVKTKQTRKKIEIILISYNTVVAKFTKNDKQIIIENMGYFSQTTTRHQKEFFKQLGYTDIEVKQIFRNGRLEKIL